MDEITLATCGTIDRHEVCPACGESMFYRVAPGSETPVAMLCGNLTECSEALKPLPMPEPKR